MKKALITLAVLGAASGAVMAQSSVTLYGMADIAIGKAASTGDKKWGAQSTTLVTDRHGSFIGVTGKEDLGDGLWAGFDFQGAVSLANGASNGWADSAWVALGSNSWGAFTAGRNYTPAFKGQAVYELTSWAHYSVVANVYGFGGFAAPRNNAQIQYSTPSIQGLGATIAYIPKADGGLLPTGVANQSDLWSGNVVYNRGPVKAALTASKFGHISGSTGWGGNANKLSWTAGGSYTFGNSFALSVSYNQTANAQQWPGPSPGNAVWGARRRGWELGGSYFVGPFTITLDLTRDVKNDLYKKYTNGVLAAKYALSKRTYLYADYLRLDGQNNYGVGIHHNF